MACKLLLQNRDPFDVVRALSSKGAKGLLFFDSGRAQPAVPGASALWSIICCEPERIYRDAPCALARFRAQQIFAPQDDAPAHARDDADLPFYGGIAGMLGFEFAWALDDIRAEAAARLTPDCWVGEYSSALVYSHRDACWWLSGDAQSDAAHQLRAALYAAGKREMPDACARVLSGDFHLTISADEYARRVQAVIDAIFAGEAFEVNYTERFRASWGLGGWELYERLRATSSGAYCAYLDAGDFQLASVSPEQFMSVKDGQVCTRPIKGTRARGQTPVEDARLADELRHSPKDRAENIMIVDLMRNDLTRVCRSGSVSALEVCGLYSFSGVHHLVSTVVGELEDGVSPVDALVACFPPGSITGAPKLRAIELIAEFEEDARGPYTGTLFYASACGDRLDSSVLIRTAVLCDGQLAYGAGGAVVADSNPREEFAEACVKAAPIAAILGAKLP